MSRTLVEFLRVVRYAIDKWQRTLCLVTVVVVIAVPAVACTAFNDVARPPADRARCTRSAVP